MQAEGLDATFLCQLPTAGSSIEWQINETSFRNVNAGEGLIRKEGCSISTAHLGTSILLCSVLKLI